MKTELQEAAAFYRRIRQAETEDFKGFIRTELIAALQRGNFAISLCAKTWPAVQRTLVLEWLDENDCRGQWEDYEGSVYLQIVYKGYQP